MKWKLEIKMKLLEKNGIRIEIEIIFKMEITLTVTMTTVTMTTLIYSPVNTVTMTTVTMTTVTMSTVSMTTIMNIHLLSQ